jgi:hypothetical protein
MERMLCAECGAVTYSAAATRLVEQGERCLRCGGQLSVEPTAPVAVAPRGEDPGQRRSTA